MSETIKAKDFISIYDLSFREVNEILSLAKELKEKQKKRKPHRLLEGKVLAMIFNKPSNRTRVSFDVGMFQLGGRAINILPAELGVGNRESLKDVASTLSRYVDGIMIRTHEHKEIVDFARHASVPVINGLTNLLHPCQALADIFTVKEYKPELKDIKFAYVGDGNNVLHSLMFAASKLGFYLSIACPKEYGPHPDIIRMSKEESNYSRAKIEIASDPKLAADGADVIYTDVWVSMGQEVNSKEKKKKFEGFQVNKDLVKLAKKDCLVMHCLPAHRGEEISEDVLDGENSVVFEQAENRLHVQKAILVKLL